MLLPQHISQAKDQNNVYKVSSFQLRAAKFVGQTDSTTNTKKGGT